jgi:hypothetical protein
MFGDGFEQSTLCTGPDGLTRVITRNSWAERELGARRGRGAGAARAPAVGGVSPRGARVHAELGHGAFLASLASRILSLMPLRSEPNNRASR